jgi:hypothetical protein
MRHTRHRRRGHSRYMVLAFLVGAVLMVWLTLEKYLLPAIVASHNIDEAGQRHLAALSSLVLAVVMVLLLAGLILLVRPGRFFLPRKPGQRTGTTYTDAWAESARRLEIPPRQDEDEPEDGR